MNIIIQYGLTIGILGFAIGFFGPMIFVPDANQGPMLGIFITGPLGFIVGLILGWIMKLVQKRNPEFKDPLTNLFSKH